MRRKFDALDDKDDKRKRKMNFFINESKKFNLLLIVNIPIIHKKFAFNVKKL